ncbi:MAG: aldose 1-epimerase family protein [Chitinophagaceae bacterium]
MFTIENSSIRAGISPKGAELQSLYSKTHATEYMWSGDPAFWGKHSPILFPIIGTLKADTYYYDNKAYQLSRHGFAREMDFEVAAQTADSITFTLQSNADTFAKFPFAFKFSIQYALDGDTLKTTYHVANTGNGLLYFSVGGHPAFKVPLSTDLSYNDYYLLFNKTENAGRWPISKDGLIETKQQALFDNTNKLPLTKELFAKDALVFKQLHSTNVALKTDKNPHGLLFDFAGFPFLGIWAAKNADFVCIEPWCGIADSVDTDQQFVHKEGIESLQPGKDFERTWSATLF